MLSILKKSRQRRGFTLTEAAIVLGIVGLILGAIWSAAGSVYRNQRVTRSSEQIIQIVQGIRSLYSTSPTVTGITASDLIKAGAIPKDMASGTTVYNLWGGAVTIDPDTCNGLAGSCFKLTLNSVPKEACIDLLTRTGGPGRDSGLANAGTSAALLPLSDSTASMSVSVAATTYCNATTNNVILVFMLKG